MLGNESIVRMIMIKKNVHGPKSSGFIFLLTNIMFWWSCSLINLILTVSKNLFFAGISHALSSVCNDVTIGLVCCNLPMLTVKIASGFTMKFMKNSAFEQLSKGLFILPTWTFLYLHLAPWGTTWKKGIFCSPSSYFPPSTAFPNAALYFHNLI